MVLSVALAKARSGQVTEAARRLDELLGADILLTDAELNPADARQQECAQEAFRRIAMVRPKVGAGQLGAVVDFAWGGTTGIDVLMIWNVATSGGITTYTMTDPNGDGIPGSPMIDGPFVGLSVNFNMQHPVRIPAAVWLLGSGLLSLVGAARRRRAEVA